MWYAASGDKFDRVRSNREIGFQSTPQAAVSPLLGLCDEVAHFRRQITGLLNRWDLDRDPRYEEQLEHPAHGHQELPR